MAKPKAVVLLSSGLDSTVNLYRALAENEVICVLTFNYGQRAAQKEISQSEKICAQLKLNHHIVDLPWLKLLGQSALTSDNIDIPVDNSVSIHEAEVSARSAKAVWVPNRNGVFLNIAAAFAEHYGAEFVIPGFNKEEAKTFPDNSQEFLKALDLSFQYSTVEGVKTLCYTTNMDKSEIVRLGQEVGAPFDLMWPCYFAGDNFCGQCESCQRFNNALNLAGISQ